MFAFERYCWIVELELNGLFNYTTLQANENTTFEINLSCAARRLKTVFVPVVTVGTICEVLYEVPALDNRMRVMMNLHRR